jgi:pimeloyl-ACP methyl ester carboxylesterase
MRLSTRCLCAAWVVALSAGAADATARTVWLCKAGQAGNPCARSLTATVVKADGSQSIERSRRARRTRIDCFYVYPTVSGQDRVNATKTAEPEQKFVAEQQAGRFSQVCRPFAPVYRQLTLRAIGGRITAAAAQRAYGDVRSAWRDYLRNHNRGRGVVLIGHSQGTYILRQLIKDEIDRRPKVRRRLVSALLLGGNVLVQKGRDSGGDFRNIRACRAARQTGCVIAYSAFYGTPPADARFGRAVSRYGVAADPATHEVLCTNPAALRGGSATLDPYFATAPFPGPLGAVIDKPPVSVSTGWVSMPGRYRASCRREAGATWLGVTPEPGDPRPAVTERIGPEWGLHLYDVNLALGNLVEVARRQAKAYARR